MLADALIATSRSFAALILIKGTVALVIGLAAAHVSRRARASVRHLLLASTFGVLLALPVAAGLTPSIALAVGAPTSRPPVSTGAMLTSPAGAPTLAPTPAFASGAAPRTVPWWAAIWLAGAACGLAWLALDLRLLRRTTQALEAWPKGQGLVRRAAASAGVGRGVDACVHPAVAAPVTAGVLRPIIVFPTDVVTWPDADVDRAIVHELEHIHRADWAVELAARVICAIYWFHPLVWVALRRLRLEAERACDDAVLTRQDGADYAAQLVTLAARLSAGRALRTPGMAHRSDLGARVTAMLDERQARGRTGTTWFAGVTVLAAVACIGIAPLRAVQTVTAQATNGPTFDRVSIGPAMPLPWSARPQPGITTDSGVTCAPWEPDTAAGTCVHINGLSARTIMSVAFGPSGLFRGSRLEVSGGPAWIDSDRFDIVAHADGREQPGSAGLSAMLRALLVSRFGLDVHRETRMIPVWELRRVREAVSPMLQPATPACVRVVETLRGVREGTVAPNDPCIGGVGPGHVTGGAIDMMQLATALSAFSGSGRTVVDRTSLPGFFAFDLQWPFERPSPRRGALGGSQRSRDLATALEEQLGLTLRDAEGPLEVLIIDRISRPAIDAP